MVGHIQQYHNTTFTRTNVGHHPFVLHSQAILNGFPSQLCPLINDNIPDFCAILIAAQYPDFSPLIIASLAAIQ
ncbi:hypothetical protein HKD37_09G024226 [Glycine soja]